MTTINDLMREFSQLVAEDRAKRITINQQPLSGIILKDNYLEFKTGLIANEDFSTAEKILDALNCLTKSERKLPVNFNGDNIFVVCRFYGDDDVINIETDCE